MSIETDILIEQNRVQKHTYMCGNLVYDKGDILH